MENMMRENISSRNKLLSDIVGGLVTAGGKRLRPALVILSAGFGKYKREKVLPAACAIEILHTATLIHDDVIDCSGLRRGRMTVAGQYGADMAIYTGDFLFTKAVLLLSRNLPAEKVDIAAKAIRTICEGEVDQYQDRYRLDTSVISYLKRISRKTAVLFSTACSLGSYLAKCPYPVARDLGRFGFNYGMAFQIRDDLLDYISDTGNEGKPVGKDIAEGAVTLPLIYALRHSSEAREAAERLVKKDGKPHAGDVGRLVELVKASGGIDYARELLSTYISRGMAILEKLPENKHCAVLSNIIQDLRV